MFLAILLLAILFQGGNSIIVSTKPLKVCQSSSCDAKPDLEGYSKTVPATVHLDQIRRDFTFNSLGEVTAANILTSLDDLQSCEANFTFDDLQDDLSKQFQNVYKYIQFTNNLYTSCSDILSNDGSSETGWYPIRIANGTVVQVYCDMEGEKCDGTGGWTRIAFFDMKNPDADICPYPLHAYQYDALDNPVCQRQESTAGCDSVYFSNYDISYSRVCGRALGYTYGSPDAFEPPWTNPTIDKTYVDGLSITRGSPRQHVWTFASGVYPTGTDQYNCPCNNGNSITTPSFVGSDYYCESGIDVGLGWNPSRIWADDPVWDGLDCPNNEAGCCTNSKQPWFTKDLGSTQQVSIEVRACDTEISSNERVPVEVLELYIR